MDQSETLLLFLLKPIRDNLAPGFPRALDLSPLHAQKSSGSRLTSSPADRASRSCAHAGKENRGILVPNATRLSFFPKDGGGKRKFNSSASSSQNSDLRVHKDEQNEQFGDIENLSAEEILKRIKRCYGEETV